MLERFQFIGNIGRFRLVKAGDTRAMEALTLVFSENGRGKTTLCAVLRSLASGTPDPILERSRLSATDPSRAVVEFDGANASFDGAAWNKPGPRVVVFDEHFVDANVHSGLAVAASHRQNLHELVLGEDGGRYLKRVRELKDQADEAQKTLRQKEREVPAEARAGLSVDDFCALPMLEGLEAQISEAQTSVGVLRNAEAVRAAPDFAPLALPTLDRAELEQLLGSSLDDIDQAALDAVTGHLGHLGEGSEAWVARGMDFAEGSSDCPFCGQDLTPSSLLGHYRAYFSDAYRAHKGRIAEMGSDIRRRFGGDMLAAIQRQLDQAREHARFWSEHVDVPEVEVDSEGLARDWTTARDRVLRLVDTKSEALLAAIELDAETSGALDEFDRRAQSIQELSEQLTATSSQLAAAREHASEGSLSAAEVRLAHLLATKKRYTPEVDAACTAYLTAKNEKERLDDEKEQAREALDEHRDRVFGQYEAVINKYLDRFHADFTIQKLEKSDAAGVPSTTYQVIVNTKSVPLAPPKEAAPSFKTALSAGDRNTLALAFFFALLDEDPHLADTIVVVDDPLSSLDAGRSHVTVQETRKVLGRAKQLVVLSHSLPLLLSLWERCETASTATLKICDSGVPDESTIEDWDADADSVTDFDRSYQLVREYAEGRGGDAREVAQELRILLERYLRVAFVEHMPAGRMLRAFIDKAVQLKADGNPILSDHDLELLEDLRDYTWSFHHDNPKWRENVATVSERQLKGYAERAIDFTRSRSRTP